LEYSREKNTLHYAINLDEPKNYILSFYII